MSGKKLMPIKKAQNMFELTLSAVDGATMVNNPTIEQARLGVAMNAPKPSDFSKVFVNQNGEDLDWGTIDVYTCSQSCQLAASGGYAAEYARVVDLNFKTN